MRVSEGGRQPSAALPECFRFPYWAMHAAATSLAWRERCGRRRTCSVATAAASAVEVADVRGWQYSGNINACIERAHTIVYIKSARFPSTAYRAFLFRAGN